MARSLMLMVSILSASVSFAAQSQDDEHRALELSVGSEQLSDNYQSWQLAALQYEQQLNPDALVYARLQNTKRFGQRDNEWSLGTYYNITSQWQTHIELSHSPSHRVRPVSAVQGWLSRTLSNGFVASVGYHRTDWDPTISQGYSGRIERYVGAWRWAYTLRHEALNGASQNGLSHQLALSRYYDEHSHISVAMSVGEELEKINLTDVVITNVKGVAVYGLHYSSNQWGWRWSVGFNKQGDYYDRIGTQIGLRYRF